MCYARRQRSSWARIKLSIKISISSIKFLPDSWLLLTFFCFVNCPLLQLTGPFSLMLFNFQCSFCTRLFRECLYILSYTAPFVNTFFVFFYVFVHIIIFQNFLHNYIYYFSGILKRSTKIKCNISVVFQAQGGGEFPAVFGNKAFNFRGFSRCKQ